MLIYCFFFIMINTNIVITRFQLFNIISLYLRPYSQNYFYLLFTTICLQLLAIGRKRKYSYY